MTKKASFIFPSLKRGGGNRMLLSIMNKFISEGYECEIFYLKNKGNSFLLPKKINETYIFSKRKSLLIKIIQIFWLCFLARRSNANYFFFSDPIIGIFSFLFKKKKIRYVQGNDEELFDKNKLASSLIIKTYKFFFRLSKRIEVDKLIFNSKYSLESYFEVNMGSNHPIVNPYVFNSSKNDIKKEPTNSIISVLSSHPRKGLEKFNRIINSGLFDDYDFSVISQENLNLNSSIKFEMPKDDNAYLEALSENSFFLSLSSFEGFGLTPLEAMSVGLIVFYYPNEGLKNYCNESNSICNEFNDLNLFKKQLDSFFADNKKFELYSRNAIKTSERFSEEIFQNKIFSIVK